MSNFYSRFSSNKDLVGMDLVRKAGKNVDPLLIEYLDGKTEIKPLGWQDICQALMPRAKDYCAAWQVFTERLKDKK